MNPLRNLFAHLAGGVGVVGVALFFLVFSCSQKLPTAPQGPPAVLKSAETEKAYDDFTKKQSGAYLEAPDLFVVELEADSVLEINSDNLDLAAVEAGQTLLKPVGISGDTIKFPIGRTDTTLLIVPEGALNLNLTISLRADLSSTQDGKISVALYEFFPEGLVYLKDCYLVQPSRFPDGTLIALSWFDPLSGKWKKESVARVQNGRAVFVIRHFSKYVAPYDGLGSGGR